MVKCWQSYSELQATEFGKRIKWHQTRKLTRSGHEMRGLSRLSRIMSRVTISVTRLQLPCDKSLGCQTSHDTLLRWHALSSDNIVSLDAALTLGYYRLLGCWRINSLLQRFYEHHSLRFQLNCVLFFRELIESLSPLWGFITRPEQGFVGWFLWQTPGWDVSLCHDCMRWGLTLPDRRGLLISWFNQSELGILTSINSDSWSV